MTDTYDPSMNLRAYAEALAATDDPTAHAWADALRWAASRIHGGHASLFAHREFRRRFGQIAEDYGVGPWDGSEGITRPASAVSSVAGPDGGAV